MGAESNQDIECFGDISNLPVKQAEQHPQRRGARSVRYDEQDFPVPILFARQDWPIFSATSCSVIGAQAGRPRDVGRCEVIARRNKGFPFRAFYQMRGLMQARSSKV
jgi:hypothetical protein